jgi:selenocysteine-specific elongation factor
MSWPDAASSEASLRPVSVVIGTAGHIDHGKTALIRALTGVDTDRLPEEKKRGITIDLGFAALIMEAIDGPPLRISFIDVPGHARFVRNMLAGTGGIDAVMLVISAEEGVKPQTEEHLAICDLLGIQHGLTVMTKIDAVSDARLREVHASVERFLGASFLGCAPVLEVSARTGAGLEALRAELAALAARIPSRSADFLLRLPVDRAFVMTGFGTVATGTLIAGSVETGQELTIEPGGRRVRVRGIQVHGSALEKAESGARVALNLSRIDASELRRGDTLVEPSSIIAVDTIDAEVTHLGNAPALKHGASLHFHAFSSECMSILSLYGVRALEPGRSGLARLRLDKKVVVTPGDRFVLRQGSPVATIGGGQVLDAHPLPRLKKEKAREWLQTLLESVGRQQIVQRVERRGKSGIAVRELAIETGLRTEAIRSRLAPWIEDGSVVLLGGDLLLARKAMVEAVAVVAGEFERLNREASAVGVKRSEVRSRTRMRPEVLDGALNILEQDGKLRIRNEHLVSAEIEVSESNPDHPRLLTICRGFEKAGLAAPSPNDLATEIGIDGGEMRRLMTILLRERKLVRLGSDALCVHSQALAGLKGKIQALRGETIDVARFKQLAGVSRKYAIPLLEYLDRERVTRKQGEFRIVL